MSLRFSSAVSLPYGHVSHWIRTVSGSPRRSSSFFTAECSMHKSLMPMTSSMSAWPWIRGSSFLKFSTDPFDRFASATKVLCSPRKKYKAATRRGSEAGFSPRSSA